MLMSMLLYTKTRINVLKTETFTDADRLTYEQTHSEKGGKHDIIHL